MNKRHFFITFLIAGLLTIILCFILVNKKVKHETNESAVQYAVRDSTDDNDDFNDALIDLPGALNSIVEGAAWPAEHFCSAGNEIYFLAEDEYKFTRALCTSDKVLVEDPSLYYVSLDTIGRTFSIAVGERSMVIDFSDAQSVSQLSKLNFGILSGFKRQRWSNVADFNDWVICPLEIDYPTASIPDRKHISRWITTVALATMTGPTRIPVSSPSMFTNTWKDRSGYKGSIDDWDAVNAYISGEYFKDIKEEWGTNEEDYPPALYSCLSLRARYYTDHYVTYQMADNGYGGGAHGYSDVLLVSYDYVNHQEIGWKYLFKSGCEEQVLKLFEKVAETNEQYKHWEAYIWAGIRLTDPDGNQTGEMLLPQPALTPAGVTISFQPYSIACFAAGTFHFTVPYSQLKPYLTDRAKSCIRI